MPRRAASPAASEHEIDILGSIFANDNDTEVKAKAKKRTGGHDEIDLDIDALLNGAEDGGDGDDEALIALQQAASFRKTTNLKGKTGKKSGGFQAMGLNPSLLQAITRKGFAVPTPIQRKSIPLILDRRDVVGMARTGSGKTAAFVIPMIERLRAHSARVGARALIMSPSRELALQTLKVVKEFGKGTDLKTVLLVGGDSLEDQFGFMTTNPDIIIATPGRFLHLKVEMSLDLSSIKYVVFDEADRLFEMGFATQLTEILHSLPPSRQTLLFSATLPRSLVEFARAGLQDPSLDVIKMPTGTPEGFKEDKDEGSKKRKRGPDRPNAKEKPTEHSTIIFTATKFHVEYLTSILVQAGYAVSHAYGALDQTARKIQVEDFRRGKTNILVVTDVAARGIDIPVLANVINYDFCDQPKVFVHRVGRTARAGQKGWSYSLVSDIDAPYLLDLQLFLGRRLVVGQDTSAGANFASDVVLGALQRNSIETNVEWVEKVVQESHDIALMRSVVVKAQKQYLRTRVSASSQSAKRARELTASRAWSQPHLIFGINTDDTEALRVEMLAKISGFKPQETVFEIGHGGKGTISEAVEVMKQLRKRAPVRKSKTDKDADDEDEDVPVIKRAKSDESSDEDASFDEDDFVAVNDDSDEELEVTVSNNADSAKNASAWRDSEHFMTYTPRQSNVAEERGYGVNAGSNGANFLEAARDVAMDIANDEKSTSFGAPTRTTMRWDKKNAKYVSRAHDEDGSRGNTKMIRGESGVKIAASFKSGRFDRWRKDNRLGKLPGVGEAETGLPRGMGGGGFGGGGRRFNHKREDAPKEADKFRDDYHVRKKRVAEAKEKRIGKFRDGEGSKREIKNNDDIRKARKIKELKMRKNARPARKKKN
ncbi:ATP-dependent RNA helicase DBP10 [Pyricularia oryzae Y34]|uniref:RNA helicase n=2 Tax=Pyricularia oryzae TaxID=318829 RepID=A0AA97P348_PYRO3|nr:ATP-dependent RNA helicase DBP10 [Pyricularia oryzae Y34]